MTRTYNSAFFKGELSATFQPEVRTTLLTIDISADEFVYASFSFDELKDFIRKGNALVAEKIADFIISDTEVSTSQDRDGSNLKFLIFIDNYTGSDMIALEPHNFKELLEDLKGFIK